MDGQEVTFPYVVTKNVTFVATYLAHENTLKFNGNGATSGETPEIAIKTTYTATLPECGFERAGYTFKGYSTNKNGSATYHAGDTYTMGTESEYTLYALWVEASEGLTYSLVNNVYSITDYTGTETEVVIPAVYNGYPVTSIGNHVFV